MVVFAKISLAAQYSIIKKVQSTNRVLHQEENTSVSNTKKQMTENFTTLG